MAESAVLSNIKRFANMPNTNTYSVSDIQEILEKVGNNDPSQAVWHLGDEVSIPETLEEGQLQSRQFGSNPTFYLVLQNKVLYFSTLRKSVTRYAEINGTVTAVTPGDKDNGNEYFYDDGAVVHAKNDFYQKVMECSTLWDILNLIKGKTLKVVAVSPAIDTARFARDAMGNAVPVALRHTTVPCFEIVS